MRSFKEWRIGVYCAAALCLVVTQARADDADLKDGGSPTFTAGDLFTSRRYEATMTSGVLFSPFGSPKNRPTINYTITELQLGWMLSPVRGRGWWRGNFELVGEGFGGAIIEGPGSYLAGATVWMRYNFVPEGWRLVPYIQAGAGLTTTDIDRGIVGMPFNFNLNLAAGVRWVFARNCSLNLEYRYQHISNADLGSRNLGINSQGPILGVSYFF
jgi:lipid A 3-O-deacylase